MNYQDAISKAMKLLAKGNDKATSPEEAALFLSKAQEIIDAYKLDVNDFNHDQEQAKDDNEPIKDFGFADPLDDVKYGQYREVWTRRLGFILASHNSCRTVYAKKADKGVMIKIIGRASDVTLVRYLYGFFKRQVEELAKEGCAGHSSAFRGQFCMGVIDTLYNKLEAVRKAQFSEAQAGAKNDMALVRVNNAIEKFQKRDNAVAAWMKQNVSTSKGRGYNPQTETGGRRQGQIAGEKLRMTRAGASLASGAKQISN